MVKFYSSQQKVTHSIKSKVVHVIKPHGLFLKIKYIQLHCQIPECQLHFSIPKINARIIGSKKWSTKMSGS